MDKCQRYQQALAGKRLTERYKEKSSLVLIFGHRVKHIFGGSIRQRNVTLNLLR